MGPRKGIPYQWDVVTTFKDDWHFYPNNITTTLWEAARGYFWGNLLAILTALANDIGTDALFQRQVIANGCEGDTVLAISTSGTSANVIAALAHARGRGMKTVALVGGLGALAERFLASAYADGHDRFHNVAFVIVDRAEPGDPAVATCHWNDAHWRRSCFGSFGSQE